MLAQPIHTAILPELVAEAREHGLVRVAASLRWALERMALLVVPASAGMVALALPAMRLVSFGEASGEGSEVLAAAVAGLALGLLPYSAFLLLARGYYALGDSRTPGRRVGGVRAGGRRGHGGRLGDGRRLRPASSCSASATRWPTPSGSWCSASASPAGPAASLWPAALGRIVAVSAVVGAGGVVVADQLVDADVGPAGRPGGRRRPRARGRRAGPRRPTSCSACGARSAGVTRPQPRTPGPTTTAEPTTEVGA